MVFSDTVFLFVFLPAVILIYYLCKPEYRNFILLVASLVFYACGEPRMVLLMILSIVCNYLFALGIEKCAHRKAILIVCIIYNLGILFLFKYLGFSISVFNRLFGTNLKTLEIALPIGISFYTFQAMSYVIDVYDRKVVAQHNVLDLGLYISLFPQLVAGPIVRYSSVASQIKSRELQPELFGQGAKRFMCGFCKKVILANNLSVVAGHYFGSQPADNAVIGAWIGAVSFSLQIFYDFSGYSDMAIGLGQMLGFRFEENFDYPYMARSVTDFWRRWHISLGRWFRDYVYIPLGGSRVPALRHIFNMAVVWILTGLWHGAAYSFIVWGFMYFAALVVEKYVIKPDEKRSIVFRAVYRVAILLYINLGWIIFNADGIRKGISYCFSLGGYYGNPLVDGTLIRMLREYGAFLILGLIFATPAAKVLSKRVATNPFMDRFLVPIGYLAVFMWALSFLILGAHNPFIYFNF